MVKYENLSLIVDKNLFLSIFFIQIKYKWGGIRPDPLRTGLCGRLQILTLSSLWNMFILQMYNIIPRTLATKDKNFKPNAWITSI